MGRKNTYCMSQYHHQKSRKMLPNKTVCVLIVYFFSGSGLPFFDYLGESFSAIDVDDHVCNTLSDYNLEKN